jgi:hypothetical protein
VYDQVSGACHIGCCNSFYTWSLAIYEVWVDIVFEIVDEVGECSRRCRNGVAWTLYDEAVRRVSARVISLRMGSRMGSQECSGW